MVRDSVRAKTVLIVDDELPSRELLKMSYDWESNGFTQILEARNGAEALEMYRHEPPYLLITDIKMPVMDGTELISIIRQTDPKQRILVLSCHDDFPFVHDTLQMGVLDYILKDSYTPQSLQIILTRALRQDALQRDDRSGAGNLLSLLLNGSATAALAQELFCSIQKVGQPYFVCACRIEQDSMSADTEQNILLNIDDMLKEHNGGDVIISKNIVYVLMFLSDTASASAREKTRFMLTRKLQFILQKHFNEHAVIIGISALCMDCGHFTLALQQARSAVSYHFFLPDQFKLFFDHIPKSMAQEDHQTQQEFMLSVRTALLKGENTNLFEALEKLFKSIGNTKNMETLQHSNVMLMSLLTQTCTTRSLSFEDIFGADRISLNMLDNLLTLDEVHDWFKKRFAALMDNLHSTKSPRIRKITAFIQQHYFEDLSLENVAQRFAIHKVYLAKVFKDEMNMSVNGYIRTVRMEQAKLMLEKNNMKISSVVETLGFNNAQTFYNLFKKHTGMSPSEYKNIHDLRRAAKISIQTEGKS